MSKQPTFTQSQPLDDAARLKQRFSGYSDHYFPQAVLPPNESVPPLPVDEKQPSEIRMSEITREELAARLETIEVRMDGRLVTIESKIDARFAELRTDMHKGTAELVKWVVGTAIAMAAVAITVMTFVLNNAVPKAPTTSQAQLQPQPVIIYAQPTPIAAPPAAPVKK